MSSIALWKFQYIRLPSNSFTFVCDGLFTVKHYGGYSNRTKPLCYSRRIPETFSVNPTAPNTTALCSAFIHSCSLLQLKEENCVSDERNTADCESAFTQSTHTANYFYVHHFFKYFISTFIAGYFSEALQKESFA